jgi:hypothetical protein
MAEILKVLHLPEQNSVAEMKVGRSGIETGFDAQRATLAGSQSDALAQVFLANDLGKTLS